MSCAIERVDDLSAMHAGACLAIWANSSTGSWFGADRAGKCGRSSEEIGRFVAAMFLEDVRSGATVDRHRLRDIRQAAAQARLSNVIVLEAGERATRVPPECCDAIFMRRVYHHLTAPSAILASIHEALRPGGRLVIIDFRPDRLLGTLTRMGVDRAEVIRAGTTSGFEVITADEWPGWDQYVVVFEKSPGSRSNAQ